MTDILMVEDDALVRVGLLRVLAAAGYSARGAASAAEALAEVLRQRPDLVVLDVGLPDGDGLDCASALRAAGFDGPLLFLTADDRPRTVQAAIERGAAAYLVKPVHGGQLLPAVQTALAGAAAWREREQRLLDALSDSRTVSAAVGLLAERHGWSLQTAFEALRRSARRDGQKVTQAATAVLHPRQDGVATNATSEEGSNPRSLE